MIPTTSTNLISIEEAESSSLTYGIDFEQSRMVGMIDNKEAILQMVYKVLNTERYSYVIYSGQYGAELTFLIGKDFGYISSELIRMINEALLVDERIISTSDYKIEKIASDSVNISFKVNSIYGEINVTREVSI